MTDDATVDDLRDVLAAIDAEAPPALELAEALAGATAVDVADAQATVYDAIDAGVLVEDDSGAFGGVRLTDEHTETPDSGDMDTGETGSSGREPRGETAGTGEDDPGKYRRVYLRAAEAVDREPWEYVEEAYVRAALEEVGFAHLLDEGHLFKTRWRVVDVSDEEEEPRRRWYFPSDDEPRPGELRRFHELLIDEAPDDYTPHYFKVERAGKAPATQFGSWKTDEARLTVEEAVAWLREGGNVGIAGRPDDPLINVDIDDDEATTPDDVPTSLRARSRSRTGWHTWYFDTEGEVPNIPTDAYGEIRTDWQYVVAPGSFVASTAEEIPDDADHPGYYTVADEAPVAEVGYEDLPEVFKEAAEAAGQRRVRPGGGGPHAVARPGRPVHVAVSRLLDRVEYVRLARETPLLAPQRRPRRAPGVRHARRRPTRSVVRLSRPRRRSQERGVRVERPPGRLAARVGRVVRGETPRRAPRGRPRPVPCPPRARGRRRPRRSRRPRRPVE